MKSKHPYLLNNAHIYREFERIALVRIKQGKRISAKGIFEQMRNNSIVAENNSSVVLNNIYTPLLAREFVNNHPNHQKHLAFRRSRKFDEFYAPQKHMPSLFD